MTNAVLSLIKDDEQNCDPVQIELDLIIQNEDVVTLFQPIFDISTYEPFAYEALSRGPKNSALHMPEALFAAAAKYNRTAQLDCLCRKKAIENFHRLIQDLAQRVNCKVVGEGLEKIEDLRVVQRLGIAFGQGYLLGKPQDQPTLTVPQDVVQTVEVVEAENSNTAHLNDCELVNSLLPEAVQPCQDDERVLAMLSRFQKNPHLLAITVLNKNKVVGILLRDEILNIFSTPFGHSLYRRSTAASMMHRDPLQVRLSDRLVDVSQRAMKRPLGQVYCPLIVCDGENGENYVGMLSIQKLLQSITKIQLEHALHSNPLSGLPGNIRIENEVQGRLDHQTSFAVLHFDLDNFKAFNDLYGYERGDKMILLVTELLQETALSSDFVGHIGGDDFVMLIEDIAWEDRVWAMLGRFSQKSAVLYDLTERKQKFIKSTDRAGDVKYFDLASLSVSALPCAPGQFSSHLEASEVIAEIKHRSKKIKGNSLVVNRRVGHD